MNGTNPSPRITLRIPGDWAHPSQLLERMPEGYELTPDALVLPDGTELEFSPLPPDEMFHEIFRTSCRRPATDEELAIVDRYTVNVALSGPGGSLDAALAMMQAGVAIVRAGGAGVFIDNSALAHGGSDWIEMTEVGDSDAISFAFTTIVSGRQDVYTMGMQVMGFPDLVMRRSDVEEHGGDTLIDIIRYICGGDKSVGVGHILADEEGPRYQIAEAPADKHDAESPMHNPFGRLRIVSLKGIAEEN